MSQPDLWKKMKRDNFSQNDLVDIAEVLKVKHEATLLRKMEVAQIDQEEKQLEFLEDIKK
ncbi:hypothetical protein [Sporosarcina sp. G11-34]|uniref:hypothetical protein n=1 Tax=Sporosarcina sp. G11-34 TaxID=2849605 RepID=UPI0022A95584|nr:hypothetical protein [Sporosarcina sp. G11-34]